VRRDANGVVVPDEESPLPWKVVFSEACAADGSTVADIGLPDDRAFIVHAANYHGRLADIVRRFVEMCNLWQTGPASELETFLEKDRALREDASALWDEMKGGGK